MGSITKDHIRESARLILPDNEFNDLLKGHIQTFKKAVESDPIKHIDPILFVAFRHNFGKPIEQIGIIIADYPPPMGATISRYEMMAMAGEAYAEEHIINKEPGEKCMPCAAFFNMEAWMKMVDKKEADDIKKEQRSIEGEKGTTEACISIGLTMDGRSNSASMPIRRGSNKLMFVGDISYNLCTAKQPEPSHADTLISFFKGVARRLDREKRQVY